MLHSIGIRPSVLINAWLSDHPLFEGEEARGANPSPALDGAIGP
jgi:hypothetical protein